MMVHPDAARSSYRDSYRVVMVAALLVIVGLMAVSPAVATLGNKYYTMTGHACTYAGTHEHWYYGSATFDQAGGVTSIQNGEHPTYCDRAQIKMYWKPYGQSWKLSTWTTTTYAINSGANYGAEKLGYTDHNVRSTSSGTWYGFKLTHGDT